MVGPSAKRKVFQYLYSEFSKNKSLICKAISWNRSGVYRVSTRDDSEVIAKLRSLAKRYSTRGFD